MRFSFGVVLGVYTLLLPAVLLSVLLPVLLLYSDRSHERVLTLSSREVALTMSQTVAAKVDAAYHESQSALRIARRIGVTPHHAHSPPAINSQSYSPARITVLGLDKLRFAKNLWLEKETRAMEQYNSGMTYISSLSLPFPHELKKKPFDSQIFDCRFSDGSAAATRWLLRGGELTSFAQLHRMHLTSPTDTLETPVNLTGCGIWNEQLKLPQSTLKNRDLLFPHIASDAMASLATSLPPSGRQWLADKEVTAARTASTAAATVSGFRIPLINEQQLEIISAQYQLVGSPVALLNRTIIAMLATMEFRGARPEKDELGEARCVSRLNVAALIDAAIQTFFKVARYSADHYTSFDLLANEGTYVPSWEEAVARDKASSNNNNKRDKRNGSVFYLIDGTGNPVHGTEGTLFAEFRSTLSSALERHPMESVSGCIGVVQSKYDGSPGSERIVSCRKSVNDDSQFVLLNELRKRTDVNVSDFRAAMLAANRSAALLRQGAQKSSSSSNAPPTHPASEFRMTSVTDPRDGSRYDVTIAPLITEDSSLWHYSIVVFTPEDFLRGDMYVRRNASIAIAVVISVVALVVTEVATLVISRHISYITLQMEDPMGLENEEDSSDTSSDDSSLFLAAQRWCRQCFHTLEESHDVETAFRQCRRTAKKLCSFVDQETLCMQFRRPPAAVVGPTAVKTSDSSSGTGSGSKRSRNESSSAAGDSSGPTPPSLSQQQQPSQQPSQQQNGRKRKSVRFATTESIAEVAAVDDAACAVNIGNSSHTHNNNNNNNLSSASDCSSSDDDPHAAAAEDGAAAGAGTALRKLPTARAIDPHEPRLYSCVVVHFTVVQRVAARQRIAASSQLLRDVTAAAAEMCHALLSRLPVMAIEQFLGDGLIFATHIRSLRRRSRTLSTVVGQLIRECGVFEKKIDGAIAANQRDSDTSSMARAEQHEQQQSDSLSRKQSSSSGAAAAAAAGAAAAAATTTAEWYEDDKNLPVVAVGIFCGSLRVLRQLSPSTADRNKNNNSNNSGGGGGDALTASPSMLGAAILSSPFSAPSSSRMMRAASFLGPLVAHAEKLCRERSAVAPTRVLVGARDAAADDLILSLTSAEQRLLSSGKESRHKKDSDLDRTTWRGREYPVLGLNRSHRRARVRGNGIVLCDEADVCADFAATAALCAEFTRDARSAAADRSRQVANPAPAKWNSLRYSIFVPRCFVGLALRPPTSLTTLPVEASTVALEPSNEQRFMCLKSTSSSSSAETEALVVLSRIATDESISVKVNVAEH